MKDCLAVYDVELSRSVPDNNSGHVAGGEPAATVVKLISVSPKETRGRYAPSTVQDL